MPNLHHLTDVGQSVWLDQISRSLLDSGELLSLIDKGVRGVTSNPTILDKAINGSTDYDDEIRRLALAGNSVPKIYETLVFDDLTRAAELFQPVYTLTHGGDGFISLEVSPLLAYDTAGTIAEAQHLFSLLHHPNIMIKVPATPEGYPAIEELISLGININITLIFSQEQYQRVVEAYLRGLERLIAAGGDPTKVASVASFFVSRVDTVVDKQLSALGITELAGTIAIANAKVAYAYFQQAFHGDRWARLAEKGAVVQRPLWASTSTKVPSYPDTMYVDNLIGPDTVNTLPLNTLNAFLDHGTVKQTITQGVDEAKKALQRLPALGVDLEEITAELTKDGIQLFIDSYRHLLASIEGKMSG